jgi:hypothetical protein
MLEPFEALPVQLEIEVLVLGDGDEAGLVDFSEPYAYPDAVPKVTIAEAT